MQDDPAAQRLKQQLHDLHGALGNLRDGLVEMSLLLHELALHEDNAAAQAARHEADDLLRRLRG
jgi:hypothetical protein